ncbi:HET-domain-containing protein, partial [Ophiobolus disseminans]
LKTTRQPDTLTQHIVSISWKSLPKTFQEAIIFARKFGVQFLWVDSLCIIQDDLDDWQAQAAEMAYIYQRSVLTIAGSSSSGPTQGIFRHANPEHLDSPITGSIGQTKLNKIRIRKPLGHDTDELPLLHRCWVHQERLLSPRYLHFGENELIWECMERIRCECGGMRPGRQIFNPTWPTPKDYLHPGVLTHPDWMMRRGPSAWHAVVSDYSGMGLTKAEDIFPAISGLAKIVREATHWQYIAGLWKKSIMVDLVWKTEQPRKAVRCEPWRAPTFSWASIMSLANRHKWETYFYATLVEAECVPQGEDPTGRLKSGYIILKGTLIR